VCSGDWSRIISPTVIEKHGTAAIFLDPPYADTANRRSNLYRKDCDQVANSVREWAIEQGKNQQLRIALCGYEGEHDMPRDWEILEWKAPGGYGSQGDDTAGKMNCHKERVWFSPACIRQSKTALWDTQFDEEEQIA
jgi:hypothetical protein